MLWAGNLNFLLRVVIWNNLLSLIKLSDKKLLLAKAKFRRFIRFKWQYV